MTYSNILKIDLDKEDILEAIKIISERLKYLNDNKILDFRFIEKIELVYKSKYSVKILLKKNIDNDHIIIFQLILGSDWRKESYSFKDLHIHKIEYWNRMFDCKRYPDGTYKYAKKYDITSIITDLVKMTKEKLEIHLKQLDLFLMAKNLK